MSDVRASLFERVGGAEAVRLLVIRLYEKILTDDLLSPFFENINVDRLRASQNAFIAMAVGGPHTYIGRSLVNAHRHLVARGLSDAHFNAVKRHMASSMADLSVASDVISEVMEIVESTRNDVLCRGEEKG